MPSVNISAVVLTVHDFDSNNCDLYSSSCLDVCLYDDINDEYSFSPGCLFSRGTTRQWNNYLHFSRTGCGQWHERETKVHLQLHSSRDGPVSHSVVELSPLKLRKRGVGV